MGHIGRRILVSLTPKPWPAANLSFRAVCSVLGKVLHLLCHCILMGMTYVIYANTPLPYGLRETRLQILHVKQPHWKQACLDLQHAAMWFLRWVPNYRWRLISQLPRPIAPWQYFSSWRTLHQLPSRAQLLPTALAYPLMCFLLLLSFKELCCSSTILHASPFPIHFASNEAPPFHPLTNMPTIHQSHTKSECCFPTQVLQDCPNRTEMGSASLSLFTVSASYSS